MSSPTTDLSPDLVEPAGLSTGPPPVPIDLDERATLARFAHQGDREALGTLAERHERALLGAAQGFLKGNHTLAREAVQNAWVRVIRHARSFDGRCAVRTWLYRIMVNECRTLAKREARRETRERDLRPAQPEASDSRRARPKLDEAVAALPERLRETILLCYHADLSHAHVAEILMVPLGTVKSRLNAALTELRTVLADVDETNS